MVSDYLTMESEEVRDLLAMIDRAEEILQLADKNYRPPVGSENNLSGSEVCDLLHISPRTLQTLRDRRQTADSVCRVERTQYPLSRIGHPGSADEELQTYPRPILGRCK